MAGTAVVPPLPPGAPPDIAAAWPAMCPPVRDRYTADGQDNRARALALRWLRWEVGRRSAAGQGNEPEKPGAGLPVEARILAIQPDHLGGTLLTTPAFRLIKQALPTAELTVLAGPWADDVPAHCPAVDRVRVCRFPAFDRAPAGQGPLARLRRKVGAYTLLLDTAAALADDRYHLAITFHPRFWWGAALSALARIPNRLGYSTPEAAAFLTQGLPMPSQPVGAASRAAPRPHAAELSLALAREVLALACRQAPPHFDGRMAYESTPAERAEAARLWRGCGLDTAPAVVAIHPSAGAPVKRWPARRFALVADHLAGRYSARIVVTGGPGDIVEAREVAAACWYKPVLLAGMTSFGVLAALLERCRFAIGTDSGAMHLATARGVPTLRLFGPADPAWWSAWAGRGGGPPALAVAAALACAPCHRLDVPAWHEAAGDGEVAYPCMRDVAAERVIEAAERLWSLTS